LAKSADWAISFHASWAVEAKGTTDD
jgi:hypothetical protein